MPFRLRTSALCLILAALLALPLPGQKTPAAKSVLKPVTLAEKDLPSKYRDFMTLVAYIITDKEKEVFLQLTNDRDRDIFIASFWKLRDPTPGTPENEFKIEHEQRFQYANTVLGRGAMRPGWMTDRGRFHIILGKPTTIDRYDSTLGLRPCEVWYYYTDGSKGMPLHFGLVFFQRGGAGDYRLYDPFVDGPRSLLTQAPGSASIDVEDYEALHDRMLEIAPGLADISISLIPGEFGYGYTPSPRNALLIAEILDSPKAKLQPSYATHFLDYKGLVSTEYMSNFVESESLVAVLTEPHLGIPFVHLAVKPRSASVDYYDAKDQYYSTFSLSVSLRRPGQPGAPGEIVYQYSRELPFYFPASEEDRIRRNGVSVEDVFPALPGTYDLTVLLQNGVGKEFSVLETRLTVPEPARQPRLSALLFGNRAQDTPGDVIAPFQAGTSKVLVDPNNLYGRGETIAWAVVAENTQALREAGLLRVVFTPTTKKSEPAKTVEVRLRDLPPARELPVVRTIEAADLAPDYYDVKASLIDGEGRVVDARSGQLAVSVAERIGHPIPNAKGAPLAGRHLLLGMMAHQAAALGRVEEADAYYRRVFEIKPDFGPGLAEYAQFQLTAGRFEACLETLARLRSDSSLRFGYLGLRGKALLGLKRWAEAEEALREAVGVYNSDTSVLNALGRCFVAQKKKAEALETLKASLRLNAEQAEAKALLAEAERLR